MSENQLAEPFTVFKYLKKKKKKRELVPKCIPQLFLGSLLGMPWSAIGQLFLNNHRQVACSRHSDSGDSTKKSVSVAKSASFENQNNGWLLSFT